MLPTIVDDIHYWRDVHKQPFPFWEAALMEVGARHHLPTTGWTRATLGRNVVFLSSHVVIKFGPPHWAGAMAREAAAMQRVATRLPVATPALVAVGTLDGWEYLIQHRLPGANLWELWQQLESTQRAELAYQHGQLMAALHALSIDAAPALLQFPWESMLREQRASCAAAMHASGVAADLVAQVDGYVASATPLLTGDTTHVLLHGDLSHLNFLVEQHNGSWQITGVIDWGDVKIGPRTHEFISPGVHMYRGEQAALEQWYRGYGVGARERTEQAEQVLMARTMLYYADDFAAMLKTCPTQRTSSIGHRSRMRFGICAASGQRVPKPGRVLLPHRPRAAHGPPHRWWHLWSAHRQAAARAAVVVHPATRTRRARSLGVRPDQGWLAAPFRGRAPTAWIRADEAVQLPVGQAAPLD